MAFAPIAMMGGGAAAFVWFGRVFGGPTEELQISSPLSIRKLLWFGTLFLTIQIAGTIGTRYLGHYGILMVSMLGGLVSSASTTAAAALLAAHGETAPDLAGMATVATSIASAISNFPMIYRVTGNAQMVRGLAIRTAAIALAGAGVAVAEYMLLIWRCFLPAVWARP